VKISIDTRTIEPGDTFIPVVGPNFNGRDFIPEAIRKGARVLDVDLASYAKKYRKKLKCSVLAITGSAGKTTTKDMMYAMLSVAFNVVKTDENQNNEVGVPLTILKADVTTDILIVEMGMRGPGQIRELAQIARPTHAVITNVGLTHVELLGSQNAIARAKSEIFLAPLSWERKNRIAFLNATSPCYDLMVKRATAAQFQVLPFGGHDKPEQNLNSCFVVGRQFGLSDDQIREGLARYHPSAHRMVQTPLRGNGILMDDAYNANPDGVAYALQQLRRYPGRKIVVLGDMLELGDFAAEAHQQVVGQALDAGVDLMVTVGQHTKGMKYDGDVMWLSHFDSKTELTALLLDEIKPGDVILVKGSRGMKMEEIVESVKEKWA